MEGDYGDVDVGPIIKVVLSISWLQTFKELHEFKFTTYFE